MHITRFTDYSLRVLMYLAVTPRDLVTIQEVAKCYGISKNHLMKVVQELSANDYITSIRGKNGGIKLKHLAENINIGHLVRMSEANSVLVECFGDDNRCLITPACGLKKILAEAMESFFVSLERYTLADIAGGKNKAQLSKFLKTNLLDVRENLES